MLALNGEDVGNIATAILVPKVARVGGTAVSAPLKVVKQTIDEYKTSVNIAKQEANKIEAARVNNNANADNTTYNLSEYQAQPKQGSLAGEPEVPNGQKPSADYIRSVDRQNEAAQILSEHGGLQIEQIPNSKKGKSPDLKINGELADVASPTTNRLDSLWQTADVKVNGENGKPGQAPNVVFNLADSPLTSSEVAQYFQKNPVNRMSRLILIKDGKVTILGEN